jgi:hypothetical protein
MKWKLPFTGKCNIWQLWMNSSEKRGEGLRVWKAMPWKKGRPNGWAFVLKAVLTILAFNRREQPCHQMAFDAELALTNYG